MMHREFTGKHMAMIFVIGFGIVIAVNFYMASVAIGGFGGVVVENSYVASQKFNGWLEEAREADKLGFSADISRSTDGRLLVETRGVPHSALLTASVRRPLGKPEDRQIAFERAGNGQFLSAASLPAGRWIVRLSVETGETRWFDEVEVR